MGYNFPNTPTLGQTFTPPAGPTWTYAGSSVWRQTVPLAIPTTLNGALPFESMAEAQAAVIASDVDGLTLMGYYEPGDFGGANYRRAPGGIEPTHGGKFQTADGAWWEIREAIFTPQMFGAKANGVTTVADPRYFDDYPAMQKLLDMRPQTSAAITATSVPSVTAVMGPTIYFPAGRYNMVGSFPWGLRIKAQTIMTGTNAGMANVTQGAQLVFPPNTPGIVLEDNATYRDQIDPTHPGSSAGTSISHLHIQGGSGDNREAHGIRIQAQCSLNFVSVGLFGGDGIRVWASIKAFTDGKTFGNVNVFHFNHIRSVSNALSGIYVEGPDTNAGIGVGIDVTANGRWGIHDSSFIGNTWIGCHADSNGIANSALNRAHKSSRIAYQGYHYGTVPTASEGQFVSTTPGTNENVWKRMGPGGPASLWPTWLPNQPLGTYFAGGPYFAENVSAPCLFLGCYVEQNQNFSTINGYSIMMGGLIGGVNPGSAVNGIGGSRLSMAGEGAGFQTSHDNHSIVLGGSGTNHDVLKWGYKVDGADPQWRFHGKGTDWRWDYGNADGAVAAVLTGKRSADQMGTAEYQPYRFRLPMLAFGQSARRHTTGTAPPTAAAPSSWAKGDVIWNLNVDSGDHAGWVCTVAGSDGTPWVKDTNYAANNYIKSTATVASIKWAAGTNYALGDHVHTTAGRTYKCVTDPGQVGVSAVEPSHTTGRAVVADNYEWLLVTPWAAGANYALNDFIVNSAGRMYRCSFDPGGALTSVEPTHVASTVTGVDGYSWVWFANLAWIVGGNYATGDVVYNAGNSYKCTFDPGGAILAATPPVHTSGEVELDGYKWLWLYAGAPPAWTSGTGYALTAFVTASSGRKYRCTIDPTGAMPSAIEPVHTSGTVTGGDGYGWELTTTKTWITSTAYTVGDGIWTADALLVERQYKCVVDPNLSRIEPIHTAGVVAGADLYGWTYSSSPQWVNGTNYATGDHIHTLAGIAYRCVTDPGVMTSSVEPTHLTGDVINTATDKYGWRYIDPWVTDTNYLLGTYIRNTTGIVYRCTSDPGSDVKSTVMPDHVTGPEPELDGYTWTVVASPVWVTGTNYALHDAITSAAGRKYRCIADPELSTVAPTHDTGIVTGVDGYGWQAAKPWTINTNYAVNDSVYTDDDRAYLCTADPGAKVSTLKPTADVSVGTPGADGYGWLRIPDTRYYKLITDPATLGIVLSSDEPDHSTGEVTGLDGMRWAHVLNVATTPLWGALGWIDRRNYAVNDEIYAPAVTRMYRCTTDPGALIGSAHQPTHETGTQAYPDGYHWTVIPSPTYVVGDKVLAQGFYASNTYSRAYYYECVAVGPGASRVLPTHVSTTAPTLYYSDGYAWKYLSKAGISVPWVDGTLYNVNMDVTTSGGRSYRCAGVGYTTDDPPVQKPSHDAPDHVEGVVTENDGYTWTFLEISLGNATPWVKDTDYNLNQYITNSEGLVYRASIAPVPIGDPPVPILSTVEPDHLSGDKDYADGYTWSYVATAALTSPWQPDVNYAQEAMVTANGNHYRLTLDPPNITPIIVHRSTVEPTHADMHYQLTFDPSVSTVAPTHLAGTAGGADLYEWLHLATTTGANWVVNTNYALNAIIKAPNGHDYQCVYDPLRLAHDKPVHTSGAATGGDGYTWTVFVNPLTTAQWASGTTYPAGTVVRATGNQYYTCVAATSYIAPTHLSGEVIGADYYGWTEQGVAVIPLWLKDTNYSVGSAIISTVNSRYYICTFDPGNVPATTPPAGIVPGQEVIPVGGDGYGWTMQGTTWITNVNYALNTVRVAPNGRTYMVTVDPSPTASPAGPSTVMPQHFAGTMNYADGYGWAYKQLPLFNWTDGADYSTGSPFVTVASPPVTESDGYTWTYISQPLNLIPPPLRWAPGNFYDKSARIITAAGLYYQNEIKLVDTPATNPGLVSTVQPTHLEGAGKVLPVEADGHAWQYLGFNTPTWTPFGETMSQQTINTDAAFTLSPATSSRQIRHIGTLTADRVVTLDTAGAYAGLRFRVARSGGGGAFVLDIGFDADVTALTVDFVSLAKLRPGEWCDVVFDGVAWYLAALGNLSTTQQTINTDASFSYPLGTGARDILHTGVLTAHRQMTLSPVGVSQGARMRITRTGGGAFMLAVGTLHAMATNTWCEAAFDGNEWYLVAAGTLDSVLSSTTPYDPPSLAAGALGAVQTMALQGAVLGDNVSVSFSLNQAGLRLEGWVSAANTVSFRFSNPTAAPIDLGAGVVKARLLQYMLADQPTATVVYNPPSLAGTTSDAPQTLALTGAVLAGVTSGVSASFSNDLGGTSLIAWMGANHSARFRFSNPTGAPLDLNSGTVRLRTIGGALFDPTDAAVVYDPPFLAAGAVGDPQTLVMPGVKLGDGVSVVFSLDLAGITLDGWVSHPDAIQFRFSNYTAGTVDLASGTVRARLIR